MGKVIRSPRNGSRGRQLESSQLSTGLIRFLPTFHLHSYSASTETNTRSSQEPQAADDNADSALGTAQSSTSSIASTILNYRTLLGRRYHSEIGNAKYWYGLSHPRTSRYVKEAPVAMVKYPAHGLAFARVSNDEKANKSQDIV